VKSMALLLLGDQAARVGTGAAITLIVPLGLLVVALAVWVVLWRRVR
jgi:hypothetical protein